MESRANSNDEAPVIAPDRDEARSEAKDLPVYGQVRYGQAFYVQPAPETES